MGLKGKTEQKIHFASSSAITYPNHGLRGSSSPVLTATGLVNGRWQFSTPLQNRHPLTDRQKLVTGDYVGDPCIGAKFGAHPSTGASGRMGEI